MTPKAVLTDAYRRRFASEKSKPSQVLRKPRVALLYHALQYLRAQAISQVSILRKMALAHFRGASLGARNQISAHVTQSLLHIRTSSQCSSIEHFSPAHPMHHVHWKVCHTGLDSLFDLLEVAHLCRRHRRPEEAQARQAALLRPVVVLDENLNIPRHAIETDFLTHNMGRRATATRQPTVTPRWESAGTTKAARHGRTLGETLDGRQGNIFSKALAAKYHPRHVQKRKGDGRVKQASNLTERAPTPTPVS